MVSNNFTVNMHFLKCRTYLKIYRRHLYLVMVRESHRKSSFLDWFDTIAKCMGLRLVWGHCTSVTVFLSIKWTLLFSRTQVTSWMLQTSSLFGLCHPFRYWWIKLIWNILCQCILNSWCMWSATLLSFLIICFIIVMHTAILR